MGFKSEAHRRKMLDLVKAGKITQKTFEAFQEDTGEAKLPERIHPKKVSSLKDLKDLGPFTKGKK